MKADASEAWDFRVSREFQFDSVILTYGNYDRSASASTAGAQFVFQSKPHLGSMKLVSEVLESGEKIAPRTLLVNDTVGNILYLHRAADLAVMVGPVNFLSEAVFPRFLDSLERHLKTVQPR